MGLTKHKLAMGGYESNEFRLFLWSFMWISRRTMYMRVCITFTHGVHTQRYLSCVTSGIFLAFAYQRLIKLVRRVRGFPSFTKMDGWVDGWSVVRIRAAHSDLDLCWRGPH